MLNQKKNLDLKKKIPWYNVSLKKQIIIIIHCFNLLTVFVLQISRAVDYSSLDFKQQISAAVVTKTSSCLLTDLTNLFVTSILIS